jgi:hypothetical protein
MLNRVISASFLLVASANADGLLSSLGLGDPKTIEQKDLQERVLTGAEVRTTQSLVYSLRVLFDG